MEKSKTISAVRVGNVVGKLAKRGVLRADVGIEGGTSWVRLGIKPETVVVRASSMITSEDIIRVSDPERCWSLIRVQ